ncbi:MAG: hypothetical protein DDT18_01841 [Actinobacteria bacterium]|nr:hypothetical protein [Actinomycetota bacterium]
MIKWYSEKFSLKAKIITALFVLFFLAGVGFAGYKINDYAENNPDACKLCHAHKDCHKPHGWRVTEAQARKDCVKCHEYKDPKKFIGS